MICLTNSYCEGIDKALTHQQYKCPICDLWTIWEHRKTHAIHTECKCNLRSGDGDYIDTEA